MFCRWDLGDPFQNRIFSSSLIDDIVSFIMEFLN